MTIITYDNKIELIKKLSNESGKSLEECRTSINNSSTYEEAAKFYSTVKCSKCGNKLLELPLYLMDATQFYCDKCGSKYTLYYMTGKMVKD